MPKIKYDWLAVDWRQSNKDIALKIGASTKYVANKRRELNQLDKLPPAWWKTCDWLKTNATIARELGLSQDTVAKRRVRLGITHKGVKETRSDKGLSKPQPHLNKPEYQQIATAQAKKSPKSGRFETNIKAKTWVVLDPNNQQYEFTNLLHFVRQNPHLFEPNDVIWRKKANGVEWCLAASGIGGLARQSNPPTNWKGWKLISVIKSNNKDKK